MDIGQPGPHLMVLMINHQKCFNKVFQRKVVMMMRIIKEGTQNKTPLNFSTLSDPFFNCTFFVCLLFLIISTFLNFWNTNNCYP